MLGKVQRSTAEGNTDLSLDDFLAKAEIAENEYISALVASCTGSAV